MRNRFRTAAACLLAVPLIALGGLFIAHRALAEPTRTDSVGLGLHITVPSSWVRRPLDGAWIYYTGCERVGVMAMVSSAKVSPLHELLDLEQQIGLSYKPFVGKNYAMIPYMGAGTAGIEVEQIKPGVQVQILTGALSCPGVDDAVKSIK